MGEQLVMVFYSGSGELGAGALHDRREIRYIDRNGGGGETPHISI